MLSSKVSLGIYICWYQMVWLTTNEFRILVDMWYPSDEPNGTGWCSLIESWNDWVLCLLLHLPWYMSVLGLVYYLGAWDLSLVSWRLELKPIPCIWTLTDVRKMIFCLIFISLFFSLPSPFRGVRGRQGTEQRIYGLSLKFMCQINVKEKVHVTSPFVMLDLDILFYGSFIPTLRRSTATAWSIGINDEHCTWTY